MTQYFISHVRAALHSYKQRRSTAEINFDLSLSELLEFTHDNCLEDVITKRGALNGLEQIDPNKGWTKTNMRFNHEFKARGSPLPNTPKRKMAEQKKEKPVRTDRLTIKQWITMLQADKKAQKDSLLKANLGETSK